MRVFRGIEAYHAVPHPVVTTGTFDGVHIGHRTIINRLNEIAAQHQGESVLFTFYPHPRMVIYPDDHDLKLLSTPAEKIKLLEHAGINNLIVHPFTKDFSRLTSVEYVREFLVNRIGTKKLVIGYNHHFGRNREGSFEHLKEFGPLYGFEVEEIPAQDIESVNVSSTKIRKALEAGDVVTANAYLGYDYPLTGQVIAGAQRGREFGFPTANIAVEYPHKLIPGNGVYAVQVELDGKLLNGMLNIGTNPTVNTGNTQHIETHLFDFEGDIYGKTITVYFKARLRDEQKFPDTESLVRQLNLDKNKSLQILV